MAKDNKDTIAPPVVTHSMDAKKAFETHPTAKICYINSKGEWLFVTPDKSFGEVVETLKKK